MELQIIAPISENEKSRVYLASHSQFGFVVQKELLGEDKSALYERIGKLEQYFFQKFTKFIMKMVSPVLWRNISRGWT